MMMTGAPIKLTQADAADVADLYNRCSDYFLLQDGAAPTLDDAREGSVAKIVKLEHAWRRLNGWSDDGFQVAPFPG